MSAGDPLKAELADTEASDEERSIANSSDSTADSTASDDGGPTKSQAVPAVENDDDDAWLDVCRQETASDLQDTGDNAQAESGDSASQDSASTSDDAESSEDRAKDPHRSDSLETNDEAALDELVGRVAAVEKIGGEAMGELKSTARSIGDSVDELDEDAQDFDFDAAIDTAGMPRDADVAPYIANAERELEEAKKAKPADIFDRIAQAAEAEYDERSGTTSRDITKLVDDRRIGTKRWTPSKTVKKRMEKLEEARRALQEDRPAQTQQAKPATVSPATEPTTEDAAHVATAPAEESSETTATERPKPAEDEKVIVSRRDKSKQQLDDQIDETDGEADDHAEEDAGLRIIPGARGRRRDRARKSRLDEDFEKIFDDDKPSIGSLRRKLRRTSEPADEAASDATPSDVAATVTEESFGANAQASSGKTGLFAGILSKLKPTKAKESDDSATTDQEDALVEAFEADGEFDRCDLEFDSAEPTDDEAWEDVVQTQKRQQQITAPVILMGLAIAAIGVGFFLKRKFFG